MKRFCIVIFLMSTLGCGAQVLQKGVKVNCGISSPLSQMKVDDWKSFLVNNGDVGAMVRLNMERLYIQSEVYVGINGRRVSSRDAKAAVSDFAAGWARPVGLTVPLLLGYKLGSTEARSNVRFFAGPVYNMLLGASNRYELFSSAIGVGFDIAGTVSVDARYMVKFASNETWDGNDEGLQVSLVLMF